MQDVMSLEGKTIVVTGAAQGIGQAVAKLAIALGGRVVAIDLNGDRLKTFADTANGRVLPYVGNVADPDFAEQRCAMSRRASAPSTASSTMPASSGPP